jgi:hypothetical protein
MQDGYLIEVNVHVTEYLVREICDTRHEISNTNETKLTSLMNITKNQKVVQIGYEWT